MIKKPSILLVDDEPNIVNSLKRLLRKEGYNLFTASNGQEGLNVLEKQQVGLIISDQRMPEMNGVEFLRQVKKLYPDTIRIILSGYTEVNTIMSAINDGEVYKFMTKPWNDEEIKVSIKRSLEQYYLQKENKALYKKVSEQNEKLEEMVQNLEKNVEERTLALQVRNNALLLSQNILENLPIGIAGLDENRFIVLGNKQIHDDLELKQGSMLGNDFCHIFPREIKQLIEETVGTKESKTATITLSEKNNLSIRVQPISESGRKGLIIITNNRSK